MKNILFVLPYVRADGSIGKIVFWAMRPDYPNVGDILGHLGHTVRREDRIWSLNVYDNQGNVIGDESTAGIKAAEVHRWLPGSTSIVINLCTAYDFTAVDKGDSEREKHYKSIIEREFGTNVEFVKNPLEQ